MCACAQLAPEPVRVQRLATGDVLRPLLGKSVNAETVACATCGLKAAVDNMHV